jgi:hypothetical protein
MCSAKVAIWFTSAKTTKQLLSDLSNFLDSVIRCFAISFVNFPGPVVLGSFGNKTSLRGPSLLQKSLAN